MARGLKSGTWWWKVKKVLGSRKTLKKAKTKKKLKIVEFDFYQIQ